MEHAGVLRPELIEALAAVDAVVAIQPRMLFEQGDGFLRLCGEERMRWVYPYRALIEAGLHVAGSSDCRVVSAAPILGMRDAVLRRTEEGVVLSPEQRLNPRQAFQMWTTHGPAGDVGRDHPSRDDHRPGSNRLRVGSDRLPP